jgi:hypothetical protein
MGGSKMKNMATILGTLFGGLLLVVAYVALMPLAAIWSLNKLFGLGIPFDFWTWLATFLLIGTFRFRLTK